MARNNQTKMKKKRFTTRETVLLSLLLVVAVIYFYTNYFFLPTMDKITQLKADKDTLQLEYNSRISLIAQKEQLADQLEEINRSYNEFKSQYYKTTNQEHFIKVLELDFIDDNDLDIASLTFNEAFPLVEYNSTEASIVPLHSSIVTFPFEGSYDGLIELISRLEKNKELIRINSLDIIKVDPTVDPTTGTPVQTVSSQKVIYQGNITIEFFIIPQDYSFPWNVGLPQYDKASTYEGSLFFYDDGGLVPPVTVVVNEGNTPVVTDPDDNDNETPGEVVDGENPTDVDDPDEVDNGEEGNDTETKPGTYVVQPGDTLWGISMKFYGTNNYVDQIMFLNNISDTRSFRSGMTINLPASR